RFCACLGAVVRAVLRRTACSDGSGSEESECSDRQFAKHPILLGIMPLNEKCPTAGILWCHFAATLCDTSQHSRESTHCLMTFNRTSEPRVLFQPRHFL